MLVDETPRSFIKKNNSYSHCPLKKRPVNVMLAEDVPKTEIKGKHRLLLFQALTRFFFFTQLKFSFTKLNKCSILNSRYP